MAKQNKTTKPFQFTSFARVVLMISFATLFQQAYAQTTTSGAIFTSCASGWTKGSCTGTGCKADCTPLYGGFASLSSVPAGSYAYKGTTSVIAASSGKSIEVNFFLFCQVLINYPFFKFITILIISILRA